MIVEQGGGISFADLCYGFSIMLCLLWALVVS